jgi:hypothetical protein
VLAILAEGWATSSPAAACNSCAVDGG